MTRERLEEIFNEMITGIPNVMQKEFGRFAKGMDFILFYLYNNQGRLVSAGEISLALNASTARVAKALGKLEKNGLIHRLKDKVDSRVTRVVVSEKGKSEIEGKKNRALGKMTEVIERVGETDVLEFLRISKKIKKSLSST